MLPQKILRFSAFWGTKLSTQECVFHSRKCNFKFLQGSDYQPHNLEAMNKRTFEREQILHLQRKLCVKKYCLKYSD